MSELSVAVRRALAMVGSHDRAELLVELGYEMEVADLRELWKWWNACDAASSGPEGKEILELFRYAGYVSEPELCFEAPTTVYRGNLGEDPRLGFSWTLS